MYTAPDGRFTAVSLLPLECSPRVLEAVVDSMLYIVDSPRNQVIAVSPSGAQRTIYRSASRPLVDARAVSALDASLASAVARGVPRDIMVRERARFVGDVGQPLPLTWDAVVPDPDGRLWLRHGQCHPDAVRSWEIIDIDGRLLGTHRSDRSIVAARGDLVAVRAFDAFEVAHLAAYRVLR